MGKQKITLEDAKQEFIDKNLIPLFNEYKNVNEKLLAETYEGYIVNSNLRDLKTGRLPYKFHKSNPYTIQNIKLWCKLNDKPFELLSHKYENCDKKLQWRCLKEDCGEIFEACWDSISHKHNCPYCINQKVRLSQSLATKNPELAKEWHPTLNGDLTPYDVTSSSGKYVWWICEKGHEWRAEICSRNNNRRCPYCSGKLPSEDYNLLVDNPELCKEWNYNKNKKNPEEYCPNTNKKVWWTCKECGHEWKASISNRNKKEKPRGCPECNESKGEKRIKEWLNLNWVYYISQTTFEGLIGLGDGLLSYDFYLPNYNLFIEYQGEFHDGTTRCQTKKQLKKQQEHDRRKREYAQKHNINLLEIWYWDYNNIEEILEKELNK